QKQATQEAQAWKSFAGKTGDGAVAPQKGAKTTSLLSLLAGQGKKAQAAGAATKLASGSLDEPALLRALFGGRGALILAGAGVKSLSALLSRGAMFSGRAALCRSLSMDHGKLLTRLLASEMLTIGPSSKGALGLSPELVGLLARGNVFCLSTLAAMRTLTRDQMQHLFGRIRQGFSSGQAERPIVKKDLLHWSGRAARTRSAILLADPEEEEDGLDPDQSKEHVVYWYLQQLLWDELDEFDRRRKRQQMGRDDD
ncbi:unnamed protein product, partial [marine sediment metagenome]